MKRYFEYFPKFWPFDPTHPLYTILFCFVRWDIDFIMFLLTKFYILNVVNQFRVKGPILDIVEHSQHHTWPNVKSCDKVLSSWYVVCRWGILKTLPNIVFFTPSHKLHKIKVIIDFFFFKVLCLGFENWDTRIAHKTWIGTLVVIGYKLWNVMLLLTKAVFPLRKVGSTLHPDLGSSLH